MTTFNFSHAGSAIIVTKNGQRIGEIKPHSNAYRFEGDSGFKGELLPTIADVKIRIEQDSE